ncbi:12012_t:CDS:2 [Funneliformis caledonium]|uniref:12012_t:CDS:1 n=1 Tax=Funneliformis caledonium TaxID=1117310 RepID=A0A9N9NED5_9GLOM|nr:12012_t:CDS:2 [Funneliformis caledonium]
MSLAYRKYGLYDILICVVSINYPHNGNNICQTILTQLQLLGLDSKDGVNHIPYSAYTLQLCVIKGLEKIKLYTKRFKELIQFFNSSKQNERLEEAQKEIASRYDTQLENDSILFDLTSIDQHPLKIL